MTGTGTQTQTTGVTTIALLVLRTGELMMDLIYIWYHVTYWSKVFISTISTHDHDLGVEATDLEF